MIHINRRGAYLAVPADRFTAFWNNPMLDVAYILIGAVFLGACALYAIACDHL